MPSFPSLAALNDWLEMRCQELWAQTQHGSQLGSVAEAWAEEARHLMPLSRPFDGFVEYAKRVSPTCLIHLERNRYSVPASFANRPVSVRVYPERVVVAAEGQIVCEHARVFARSHERKSTTTVFDWRHYLAVIQRKPGALRNGAPFAELPPAFRALQQRMLKTPGGDREMSRSSPWFSSTTSRLYWLPWNWRWRLACRPRRSGLPGGRPLPRPARSPRPARTLNGGARSPSAPRHPSNRVRKSIGRQAVKKPNEPLRPEVPKAANATKSKVVVNRNG